MGRNVREWLDLSNQFGAQRAALAARFRRGYRGHNWIQNGVKWRGLIRREEEARLFFGAHNIV